MLERHQYQNVLTTETLAEYVFFFDKANPPYRITMIRRVGPSFTPHIRDGLGPGEMDEVEGI